MILIGSQAAKIQGMIFRRLVSEHEYDLIGTKKEYEEFIVADHLTILSAQESSLFPGKFKIKLIYDGSHYEVEFDATENYSNAMITAVWGDQSIKKKVLGFDIVVPPGDCLYLTKRSHANFDVHFDKTLSDLNEMHSMKWDRKVWGFDMKKNPKNYNDPLMYFLARHNEAKERFGKKQERIKLNKTNEVFFEAGEEFRYFEHDSLHRAVAYFPDYPMFIRCKRDPNLAKIENDLFDRLDQEFRIVMLQEEAAVIYLERDYIPNFYLKGVEPSLKDKRIGFRNAVRKTLKDLMKGHIQHFGIDHAYEIMHPEAWFDPIARFHAALNSNKLVKL